MFPANFAKFLRTSFLWNISRQLLLIFFNSIYYFSTWRTNRNQSLSIFGHVLSQHSNVINIMNLNDLVVAEWKHTFLGDITWDLAVLCRLTSISLCTYWISVPSLSCNYSPMEHLNIRLNLKWNLRNKFVKKCSQIFIKTLRKTPVPESLF